MKRDNPLPTPFFPIAIAFLSGIVISDYLAFSLKIESLSRIVSVVFVCFVILLVLGLILRPNKGRSSIFSDALLIILCLLGGTIRLIASCQIPDNHIAHFQAEDVPVYLEGTVTEKPVYYSPKNELRENDKEGGYFILQTEHLSWGAENVSVTGKIKVSFSVNNESEKISLDNLIRYGNRLRVLGRISSPSEPTNPGEFDSRLSLKRNSIHKTLIIKHINHINLFGSNKTVWGSLQEIREFLSSRIDDYFPNPQKDAAAHSGARSASAETRREPRLWRDDAKSGLLKALLLGERSAVSNRIESVFRQTGTIHYLSVSGLHLAMMTGFFYLIMGLLGITGRTRALLLMAIALLYALLSGMATPISRALIMVIIYFGAEIFNRKPNPLNALSLSALVITLYNPQETFDIGFQLSFISVLSIINFTPFFLSLFIRDDNKELLPDFLQPSIPERIIIFLRDYLYNGVAVSLSVTLGIFLIVFSYFNIISPISILANLVLTPLIFIIMLVGFINLVFISAGVYSLFIPLLSGIIHCLFWLAKLFSHLPFAYFYLQYAPAVFIWLFYAVFFLYLIRHKLKAIRLAYFVVFYILFILVFIGWASLSGLSRSKGNLTITMLDVRQGACLVIETPEGKTILYDAGTASPRDVGSNVIARFLWSRGIREIDILILSHSHLDHIDGVPNIIERFKVKKVFVSPYFDYTSNGKRVMKLLRGHCRELENVALGDQIQFDSLVTAEVLNPPPVVSRFSSKDENDFSLCLKIKYLNRTILLTGDIERKGIEWLTQNEDIDIRADILQIPHHGLSIRGDKPSLPNPHNELIRKVQPTYALINTGEEPDEDVLEIYKKGNIKILSNHIYGAVRIEIVKESIWIWFGSSPLRW
ncbi:MAG: DNA internalization-related competence protein ComEC/Rec2 [Planctomycetota bacterium]|nr:DNA internalization-related competence protein ComEC/Rec2 [Planctomycetota bacterium]MDI6788188.1 DNA internalization-related competence protein ComEC/Rec2 [Planctomycetota bacterium]